MIIRKPYAFLIKKFKKIHIALLLVSLYVVYKLFNVYSFVDDFMRFGTYDLYANPISKTINPLLMYSVLFICGFSSALILLLRHKGKPWKAYLIPFIEYLVLFFVLNMIKGFFRNFTSYVETTDLRFSRDLLFMFMIGQVPALYIFVMRTFGLDIQKFNFNFDKEFLELSEADREEIEISLNVDKNTFKRMYRKFIRYLGYFYQEHKIICTTLIAFICILFVYNVFTFIFVTNRSYKEGDNYNINGFNIKVNNSYYSKYNYKGELVSKTSNFVILDISVTNNGEPRKINYDYFHLKNRNKDYTTTNKLYSTDFQDLGTVHDTVRELKRGETVNFIIIYKVDNKLSKNGFVLFYQETGARNTLRKYKLKITDLDKKIENKEYKFTEDIPITFNGKKDIIDFSSVDFSDSFEYRSFRCNKRTCDSLIKNLVAKDGYLIMKIYFNSTTFEAKNMIDFISKYGIIVYKDKDGYDRTLEYHNPIPYNYYGKIVFVEIPNDFSLEDPYGIEVNVRGNKYYYGLS